MVIISEKAAIDGLTLTEIVLCLPVHHWKVTWPQVVELAETHLGIWGWGLGKHDQHPLC